MSHEEEAYFWVSLGESWSSTCECVCLFIGRVGWKVRFIPVGDYRVSPPRQALGVPSSSFWQSGHSVNARGFPETTKVEAVSLRVCLRS